MGTDSLFGHLALRFGTHPEDLATEGLAYVLGASPVARAALLRFLRPASSTLPRDLRFATQVSGQEAERPDLVGSDEQGRKLLIVEAKFWAGLQETQPVAYLEGVAGGPGPVLLFIAPALRVEPLWRELRARASHLTSGAVPEVAGELRWQPCGPGRVLALTSWRALLNVLHHDLVAASEVLLAGDVAQLNGLCERMDSDAFIPLTSDEITGSQPRRVLDYCRLVTDLTAWAVEAGLADVTGLRPSATASYYGRFLRIHGWGCFLGAKEDHWARFGITPIWVEVQDEQFKSTSRVREALAQFEHADPPRMIFESGWVRVPLRLPLGVERDAVMADLKRQLADLAMAIRDCISRTGEQPLAPAPAAELEATGPDGSTRG